MKIRFFTILFTSLALSLLGVTSVFAATYTVDDLTDTADDEECVIDTTFRDAIGCALGNPGADVIDFSGSGTINLTANAPNITDTGGLTIDGGGDITINGSNHTYGGLDLAGDDIQLKAITIDKMSESGIYLGGTGNTIGGDDVADRVYVLGNDNDGNGYGIYPVGSTNATIKNNYVGVQSNGTTRAANQAGIYLAGSNSGLTIEDNVIVSKNYCAIVLTAWSGGTMSDIRIEGNKIGTNAAGTADLTAGSGICDFPAVGGPSETITGMVRIGGNTTTDATARNIISGNGSGIILKSDYSGGLEIQGNYIGTDVNGTADVGNFQGIELENSSCSGNCNIGGDVVGKRNVISGNDDNGIKIYGDSSGWTVQQNYIGMDSTGDTALLNSGDGVEIGGAATSITIGETDAEPASQNVIAGNGGTGILLDSATGTIAINGNYIGLNAAGNAADSNGSHNIYVNGGSSTLTIGHADTTTVNNVIAGTGVNNSALYIDNITGGTINAYGNVIGLVADQSGQADPDGGTAGPLVYLNQVGASAEVNIGSTRSGGFNVIAGGDDDGVQVASNNSGTINIRGNFVGVASNQTSVFANDGDGMDISASVSIGGAGGEQGNVIGGHSNQIRVTNNASNVMIVGNFLGQTTTGADITGSENAIVDEGSTTLTIGQNNYISGSGRAVDLQGTTDVSMIGNIIGFGSADQDRATGEGVVISGAADNITIGGSNVSDRNVISNVSDSGIIVNSTHANSDVEIMGNYIGTSTDGTADKGNSTHGIDVQQGVNVFIGRNADGTTHAGNVISGNGGVGVYVFETEGDVSDVYIEANKIGVNAAATAAVANDNHGVNVDNAENVFIGGDDEASRNIIGGNGANGIRLDAGVGVTITGNLIGTAQSTISATATDLGNAINGIYLMDGSTSNVIGYTYAEGLAGVKGNVIDFNAKGIVIDGSSSNNNAVRGNLIGASGNQSARMELTNSANNGVSTSGTTFTTSNTSRIDGTSDMGGSKMDIYSASDTATVYESTTTIEGDGSFMVNRDFTALADDNYFFQITEADGDTTAFGSSVVVADDMFPVTPEASGQTTPVASTDAQTLTITKEPYSSLIRTDKDPDVVISTIDADVSEEYSTGVLSEGTNTFTFISKDYSDNSSEVLTVTIVVDTTAPDDPGITSSTSVIDTATTKSHTITGTKEAGSSIENDNVEVVAADAETTWEYEVTLAIGDNVYSFTAVDALANESGATAHTVSYTQDADAPSAPLITSSIADTTTTAYTFTGTKEADSSVLEDDVVVVALDGLTTWSWETTLSEGANAFSFTSKDALDNESSATLTSITLDTTVPTAATITSATTASGDEATASFTVTGTKEADSAVYLNDVEVVAADAETTWSYATTLSVGANLVGPFTLKDALDNESGETSTTITYTQNDLTPVYYGGGGGGGDGGSSSSSDSSVSESTGVAATEGTETAVEGSEEVEEEVVVEEEIEEEVVEEEVIEEEVVEEIVEEVVEEVDEGPSIIEEVIEVVYEAVETVGDAVETVGEVAEDLFSASDEPAEPAFVVEVVELPETTVEVVTTRADVLEEAAYAAITLDADGDQIPDSLEQIYFDSTDVMDLSADTDNDGLTDGEELVMGTDLLSSDSDGDGISDVEEIAAGTSAVLIDSDADGLTDAEEAELGTSSGSSDSDGDGFSDYIEIKYGTSGSSGALDASVVIQDDDNDGAADAWEEEFKMEEIDYAAPQYIAEVDAEIVLPMQMRDTDGDGVTDWVEMNRGTDPNDSDSDNDGLSDSDEIFVYLTDPIEKSRDQEQIYKPRIANLREEAVFTGNQATLVGVGYPNSHVEVLFLPHNFIAPTTDLVSFGRFLMANLFEDGLAQDIYEQTVQTDASGKFLIQEDLPVGSFDVIIRSYDADGNLTGETLPYEIEVQEELAEGSVTPHRLDDEAIDLTNLQMVMIENSRPILYGQATNGYEIEGLWASELFSSSLMIDTDADEGEFVMMAPNNLEDGAHELVVQGIDPLSNLYTAAINLDFLVNDETPELAEQDTNPRMKVIGVGLGATLIVIVLCFVARKKYLKTK